MKLSQVGCGIKISIRLSDSEVVITSVRAILCSGGGKGCWKRHQDSLSSMWRGGCNDSGRNISPLKLGMILGG